MNKDSINQYTQPIIYSAQNSRACVPLLLEALLKDPAIDEYWKPVLSSFVINTKSVIHLGIFIEPYLQFIIDEKKTLESRFSINRTAPYCKVKGGELLLLKKSGGPIVGICQISHAWSYILDTEKWDDLKTHHAKALCIQGSKFWIDKEKAKYVTLMKIRHVLQLENPIQFLKSDRRGWLVL